MAGERPCLRLHPHIEAMISKIPDGHSFFQTSPNSYFGTSSHKVVQKETETVSKKGRGLKKMREQNTEPLPEGGPVEPATLLSVVKKEAKKKKKKSTTKKGKTVEPYDRYYSNF